ncbi:restriction endonuclease subunit S [Geofilum rhodophaeum]|uniref:restriction endonuclease subunit S n=1 Tax=Geofilum rhodophaeum TaxID=1965019 RepID=UPI0011BAC8A3|nr:restriction endonuclease subunit S [Geofilum rhodophaeum]
MTNWKEYKLGEIGEVITGKTPSKKNPEQWGDNMPFVTPTDFDAYNKNIWGSLRYLSEEGINAFQKKVLPADSVIVTCIGSQMGKVALNKKKCVTNQQINSIIPHKEFDSDFIYYVISSMQDYLRNLATGGSTMPIVNKSTFEDITIKAPDLPTQTAIAEILSSLDDKIELNNKINQELENLAQTLFKQWFIDFEFPNEKGEPYKSSGGEMVDSELGEIPKGWEVGNLNQIAELQKKNKKPFENPDTIYHHYSLPEFDSGKMPSKELGEKILSSKYQVLEHSILVSKLNPRIPRIWTIIKPNDNSICSTEFQVLKPLEDVFFPFVNCLCSSDGYINSIQSKVTGTSSSHQRVNPKDIINYEMVLPPLSIVNQFYDSVYDSLNLIDDNRKENQELTNLRDTLLPKLISGELEVAEVMAEKA